MSQFKALHASDVADSNYKKRITLDCGYVNKMKKILDSLDIRGNEFSSNKFIMHILAKLDDSYESFVANY